MANFNGSARTNYFRVKDREAFQAWLDTLPDLLLIEGKDGRVGFLSECPDTGSFPSFRWGADIAEDVVDWAAELSPHLAEGEVAILMQCGAEKLRYLSGWSQAIFGDGRDVWVSMDDIYAKAAKAFKVPGASITEAMY